MTDDSWRIDASKLPKPVDLELPNAIIAKLEQRSRETGRSLNELIVELIDRGLGN
ncbi:MAG: hypothetical protein RLZZ515_964 [Cyanobacteriota bacterium]|jgi:hypothetical protein